MVPSIAGSLAACRAAWVWVFAGEDNRGVQGLVRHQAAWSEEGTLCGGAAGQGHPRHRRHRGAALCEWHTARGVAGGGQGRTGTEGDQEGEGELEGKVGEGNTQAFASLPLVVLPLCRSLPFASLKSANRHRTAKLGNRSRARATRTTSSGRGRGTSRRTHRGTWC